MSKLVRRIDTRNHLTIGINNYWTANDFSLFFDSLERLYIYYRLQDALVEGYARREQELSKSKMFNDLPEIQMLRFGFYREVVELMNKPSTGKSSHLPIVGLAIFDGGLEVKEIQFSSPGFVDLLGVGKVLEQICDVFKYYFPNKEKKIQIDLMEVEKEGMTLENELRKQELLSKKIENLKMMGFELSAIQTMVGVEYHQVDNIKNLINRGNIVDLKITEEEKL